MLLRCGPSLARPTGEGEAEIGVVAQTSPPLCTTTGIRIYPSTALRCAQQPGELSALPPGTQCA